MPDALTPHPRIVPVILSGGAGTRLWPLSREAYPKQLLSLTEDLSLLQITANRVSVDAGFEPPLQVCNSEHRFIVAEQLRHIAVKPKAIVLEPMGRNTAPAVAAAAIMLEHQDPMALMLVLPSDHLIADAAEFGSAVRTGATAAADGALVTFGMRPDRPETGYGYIRRGERLGNREGCYKAAQFVEKPDLATAKTYLADGGFDWNSGMFLFSVESYLSELERLEPDMVAGCRRAVLERFTV